MAAGDETTAAAAAAARWGDMDADCLVEILRRLPLDDVSSSTPLVCRSWRAASRDPSLFRALDLAAGAAARFMPWSPLGAAFASRYGVTRFTFSGYLRLCLSLAAAESGESAVVEHLTLPPLLAAGDLDLISLRCPNLRSITLPPLSAAAADDARLPTAVTNWPHLEHMELTHLPSSFPATAAMLAASCPKFSSLKIAGGAIREVDAAAIAASLAPRRLRRLSLDGCYLPRRELLAVIHGFRGGGGEMTWLSARRCVGFDEGDEEVAREAAVIARFEIGGSRLVDKFDFGDVDGQDDDTSSYVDVM
uniref:F-box domain-containing protein n=1 Tax=Leersia perrieri TaxID=77586 RepID=A0A0D9Y1A7_9ORYZ